MLAAAVCVISVGDLCSGVPGCCLKSDPGKRNPGLAQCHVGSTIE